MPYIDIKLASPCPPEAADRFARRITALVVDVLRKKPELAAASVHCVAPSRWYVGGMPLAAQGRASFFVEVFVTEGSNSRQEKADFISAAYAAAEAMLGALDAASYVVVHEIAADSWGYQGRTQEFRRHGARLGEAAA